MLNSVKDLKGFSLVAGSDEIGHLHELYFDDHLWVVRHLVVDTGGWMSGRRVLVSPHAVQSIDVEQRQLQVSLTRQQVENAPDADTDRPVSRQYEIAAYDFYGYPYYWNGAGLWGMFDMPIAGVVVPPRPLPDDNADTAAAQPELSGHPDPTLRSSREVTGYAVAATDGAIGHVHDFLFDARTWQVLLMVVDTHDWLPDRLVLIPPAWVEAVDWTAHHVRVNVSRQRVESSPAYKAGQTFQGDEVARAQRHFEGMV